MNFATTKQRILQYIDSKGISVANFFIETGIKRGFLDTDKLNATVSDLFLAKIIATYEDLNLYWLVTGEGKMISEKEEIKYTVESNQLDIANEPSKDNEIIAVLKDQVAELKKDKSELMKDKEKLFNLLETKLGKQKAS